MLVATPWVCQHTRLLLGLPLDLPLLRKQLALMALPPASYFLIFCSQVQYPDLECDDYNPFQNLMIISKGERN
ncbi:unnamed protein product, partial [Rangifer tarandus platyrhynchus]